VRCPGCGGKLGVLNTRVAPQGVTRYRACDGCGGRVKTFETVPPPEVEPEAEPPKRANPPGR
jgi:transcriptional regulator NrdR family protein